MFINDLYIGKNLKVISEDFINDNFPNISMYRPNIGDEIVVDYIEEIYDEDYYRIDIVSVTNDNASSSFKVYPDDDLSNIFREV